MTVGASLFSKYISNIYILFPFTVFHEIWVAKHNSNIRSVFVVYNTSAHFKCLTITNIHICILAKPSYKWKLVMATESHCESVQTLYRMWQTTKKCQTLKKKKFHLNCGKIYKIFGLRKDCVVNTIDESTYCN